MTRRVVARKWRQIHEERLRGMSPEQRARWDKAMHLARIRYRSEIRKYRGIPRIRRLYRARKR